MPVPEDEFDSMGTNVLALAPRVGLAVNGNPETKRRLETAGVEILIYEGKELSKLFSVNFIDAKHPGTELQRAVLDRVAGQIANYDLVLVMDFGHGLLEDPVRDYVQDKARFLRISPAGLREQSSWCTECARAGSGSRTISTPRRSK